MKIFFTASYFGKEKYQSNYDLVRKTLEATGIELLSPEVGNYLSVLKETDYKQRSKKKLHYEAIRRGILSSQAVVIEISHEDFQLGHEATLAIMTKKPVLCLSIHEDFSKKIVNPYFFAAKYNEYNIEEIVGNFIKRIEKEALDQRFNLFLSKRQLENLESTSKRMGMNNSEYLRMLLDKNSRD